MTKKIINIGSSENSGNGDPLRVAFSKINDNFTELYTTAVNDIDLSAVDQDIVPAANLTYDLGSPTHKWHSLYVGTGSVYIGDAVLSLLNGKLNSSVGFSTNNLTVGGVNVTVNEDGALVSSGGFVGAVTGAVDWTNILNKPSILTNLASNDTLTFDDGLTIANSVIGYSSSDTISEEIPGGTISETTTLESQIEITNTNVVIAKRIIQVVDDGVTTSIDSAGSTVEVSDAGAFVKHYIEPEGPSNSMYFQVRADNDGAILEGVEEDLAGNTYGRITAAQGVVTINAAAGGIDKEWVFISDGDLYLPQDGTITGTNDVHVKSLVDENSSGLFLNGNRLVGTAMLYANGNAIIRADNNGTAKDWSFGKNATLTTPLMLPTTFTAVLDDAHRTVGDTISGDPWQYTVSFVVGLGGVVETQIDNPDWPTNPGYASGDEFEFTEADHGIPGFAFAVTLNAVSEVPETGFVVMLGVTPPPEYPSTVSSLGAIKLSANTSNWVFDPNGTLHYPDGSFGSTAFIGIAETISNTSNVTITSNSNTTPQTWTFTDTGELQLPSAGSIRQNNSWTRTVAPTVSVGPGSVVWSSNVDYISSAKLVIQVEGNEIDDVSGWHSQACEAIIACRGYANTYGGPGGDPQMIVYGIVHTSINPLVTFTVQRNPTTKFVEVVGTLTAAASGNASLRIHSVEMSTRD